MSKRSLQIGWIGIAALLGGCSLTPQFQRPEAPISSTYPTAENAAAARAAAEIGWREFFTDARLQALIATSLENNRDLRTAALRIEEARAQYRIQSADQLPTIGLNATESRQRVLSTFSPGSNAFQVQNFQVNLGITAFELDFFGRVRSLKDAALNAYLATAEARQAAQISLVAEVAKAYLNERGYAEQLALAQQTLEGRETGYRLAQQRFDVGASSALDLRQNQTLVETARVSLLALQRQRAQAENALTLLVGAPLNSIVNLPAGAGVSNQNIANDLGPGLPSELLIRRPDIRAAELRLRAANANIGAARAAFFPRISLTATFGTASTELSGLFDAGSRVWSFIPQLTLPIFDAGRNRATLDLTEVRRNLAVADYEKTIQVAFREVADTLVARGNLEQQITAQQAVQDADADRLKLADLRYQNGIASSLDVLDAQRELFSAQQSLVQTKLLRLTNAIDLYRALGGGIRESGVPLATR